MDQTRLVIRVQQDSQGASQPSPGNLAQPRQLAEGTRPPWALPAVPAPQVLSPTQAQRLADEGVAALRRMADKAGSLVAVPAAPALPTIPAAPRLPALPPAPAMPSVPAPPSTQPHARPLAPGGASAPGVYGLLPPEVSTKQMPYTPGMQPPVQAGAVVPPPVQPGAAQQPAQPGGWLAALNDRLNQANARLQIPAAPALPQLPTVQLPGALGKLAQAGNAATSAMGLVSSAMTKMLPVVGPLVSGIELATEALKGIGAVARGIGQMRAATATEGGRGWLKFFDDLGQSAADFYDGTIGQIPVVGKVHKATREGIFNAWDGAINNNEALRMQQVKNLQFFGASAQSMIAGDVVQAKLDQMKKALNETGDGFLARTFGGVMKLKEMVTALETHQRLRPAIMADASRLAPYSGQLSAAQAQAAGMRIRADVRAADAHGESLARYVAADASYEIAMRNALAPLKEAMLKQAAQLAEAQGDPEKLHDLLSKLKDDSQFLKLIREDSQQMAKFNQKMAEELRKLREDAERSRMDGDDILRQLRDGVQLLDNINAAEDPLAWDDANAIKPLE